MFENHGNLLQSEESDVQLIDESSSRNLKPDSFCIHQINGSTNTLITTVEYKPPHKLSVENLQMGLRSMRFWEHIVQSDTIPDKAKDEKLRYHAEQLTGSVLVQKYHVMIQHGLEYSYITTGLAIILLHISYDDPSTLYYYLCEPNTDVTSENSEVFQSKTAVARILCFCLMCFLSDIRNQEWRNAARSQLNTWISSFDSTQSEIPNNELQQTPPELEYPSSEYVLSECLPSSPLQPGRRVSTRSRTTCAPIDTSLQSDHIDSSDSDSGPASHGRKRGFSQVMSCPPSQRSSARSAGPSPRPSSGQHQHTTHYCTQRCLLSLQQGGELDHQCPNVSLHQQGQNGDHHPIDARKLVQLLKAQLDCDLDHNCTPFGISEVYQVLKKAQGSAVPVFLGMIDLKLVLFIHGAGDIRHMLLMGWAGESIDKVKVSTLNDEISKSVREIRMLGVVHKDLRPANMLWNHELRRVLIIDFHRSDIDRRPKQRRVGSFKRSLHGVGIKRPCNDNGWTGHISTITGADVQSSV
ncbi:hypothetical protein BDBG_05131 [Blastomyces gilchristii SLH14081]|uniref:Protein kinase domain-containing protein n=1 Tax=Blastomyces gilchristii (strain SLH14081) TaxID=559298 RepID=A0A179UNA7_BLAGS|nr:uncharacterized protein BDBG_05131 [Blastomyces gilchristii SLH14081]OAT09330.1 hypothetical protein BDBG_05131 [Blastomyces gilchristii SLH14081]